MKSSVKRMLVMTGELTGWQICGARYVRVGEVAGKVAGEYMSKGNFLWGEGGGTNQTH